MERTYIAIDLKSFYASVECVERGLDPLTAHLVVADKSRTSKTICLAVSPAMKALGIPGRPRLFEVEQQIRTLNTLRRNKAPGKHFSGKAMDSVSLSDPSMEADFFIAVPQMAHYIDISTRIYQLYLRFIAPEDIHIYSIDEVFIDATPYLRPLGMTPRQLAETLIHTVLKETGITATAGIGSNLYLCKVAMDIVAKHLPPDRHGVRIGELSEMDYRRLLWAHRPLTDFWRLGRGYAKKLEQHGLYTMGDIARCSLGGPGEYYNQSLLYRLFGVNAELLIDHAWGLEPCGMAQIKAYRPSARSLGSGQVLQEPYPCEKARLVVREMADMLALELAGKGLTTAQLTLVIGYDRESLLDPQRKAAYNGPVVTDAYGRQIPKSVHGTIRLNSPTASSLELLEAVTRLFESIVHPALLVRRINLSAENVLSREEAAARCPQQLNLFADAGALARQDREREKESQRQKALLHIKKKFGKNAILRGMSLEEGATARQRNQQIGGHKA